MSMISDICEKVRSWLSNIVLSCARPGWSVLKTALLACLLAAQHNVLNVGHSAQRSISACSPILEMIFKIVYTTLKLGSFSCQLKNYKFLMIPSFLISADMALIPQTRTSVASFVIIVSIIVCMQLSICCWSHTMPRYLVKILESITISLTKQQIMGENGSF